MIDRMRTVHWLVIIVAVMRTMANVFAAQHVGS